MWPIFATTISDICNQLDIRQKKYPAQPRVNPEYYLCNCRILFFFCKHLYLWTLYRKSLVPQSTVVLINILILLKAVPSLVNFMEVIFRSSALTHSLTDNVTNSPFSHISVFFCGLIRMLFTFLPPKIWWGSNLWWLEEWKSWAYVVLLMSGIECLLTNIIASMKVWNYFNKLPKKTIITYFI